MWGWNIDLTETSLNDKNVICEKSNCLIHTISLVIFLLAIISCYSY